MSKKKKQSAIAGTYALCITVGVIVGFGLGAIAGNLILTLLLGTVAGAAAGHLFTRQARMQLRSHHHH